MMCSTQAAPARSDPRHGVRRTDARRLPEQHAWPAAPGAGRSSSALHARTGRCSFQDQAAGLLASDVSPHALARPGSRVVLVAPHPDDEVLGVGACVAALGRAGHEVLIIAVTDGTASHPGSSMWTAERLMQARADESRRALRRMGFDADLLRLGLPDGGLPAHEAALERRLTGLLRAGDTVFVTWEHDGHADHEVCGRAAARAAQRCGAHCIEFPVWALVPTHPAHRRLDAAALCRVDVELALAARKIAAIGEFASQLAPDPSTGAAAVLPEAALQVWRQPAEWVMARSLASMPMHSLAAAAAPGRLL